MQSTYIIDAVRTPIGKYGGSLATVRPDDLLATTIRMLLARNKNCNPEHIEEVIAGAANQAGEDNRNVARMSALLAGLPDSVAGVTVNRLCASGLQSIIDASRAIASGDGDLYLAGGVESMTRAPFVQAKATEAFERSATMYDTTMGWRFTNPAWPEHLPPYTMGQTAENIAAAWAISRETQDEYAYHSQLKYQHAHEHNWFANELIGIEIKNKKELIIFDKDEHPRLSQVSKLATLFPAFVKNGTVTAGNSSGINDGAACLLMASETYIKTHNIVPIAKIIGKAVTGVSPSIMGIGPVSASLKALSRAGLSVGDIGLWELNEAFASQSIACIKELGLDANLVNIAGGAIALGHPLGASGARISATLLHAMLRTQTRYGVATMCVGLGQGVAVVYELCL